MLTEMKAGQKRPSRTVEAARLVLAKVYPPIRRT
jgi:hypothetical protein